MECEGRLEDALAYMQRDLQIDSSMKKGDRNGWLLNKYTYFDDNDRLYFAKPDLEQFGVRSFLVHSVTDVPMVTNREFLYVRNFKREEDEFLVFSECIMLESALEPKSLQANMRVLYKWKQVGEKVQVTLYNHVDPMGMIPAIIYNTQIGLSATDLLDIKHKTEEAYKLRKEM